MGLAGPSSAARMTRRRSKPETIEQIGPFYGPVWITVQRDIDAASVAWRQGDYCEVLDLCRNGSYRIPSLVRECRSDCCGVPNVFPVWDFLIALAPVVLDSQSIEALRDMALGLELPKYAVEAATALNRIQRIRELYQSLATLPGQFQSELSKVFPDASFTLYAAEHFGIVRRARSGKSYSVTLAIGSLDGPLR